MNIKWYSFIITCMLTTALLLVACQPSAEGSYKPPFLPLTVKVDTEGRISFIAQKDITYPTFLGTFSAGISIDTAQYSNVENTLTVRLDGVDHVYNLHGQDFDLKFESGYYERIALRKEGTNLFLELQRTIIDRPTSAPSIQTSCQSLADRLPQSPQAIKAKFNIPSDRNIRLFYEVCPEAANGFVLKEGPRITLQVPEGGCIDSDDRADFSDQTEPESSGGRRAYSGTVENAAMTYRIAGCAEKP